MRRARSRLLGLLVAGACAALATASCFPDYTFLPAGATPPDSGGGDGPASGPDATADGAVDGPGADTGVPDATLDTGPAESGAPDAGPGDASEGGAGDGAPPPDDAAAMVPFAGGSFDFVVSGPKVHATLDYSFAIDAKEVTVARFRAWVVAGMHPPCTGTQPCALDTKSPYAPAMLWDPSWNALAASTGYAGDVNGCPDVAAGGSATYELSDGGATSEAYPVTCVNWAQAAAFCWSEGKRLPTTTEWYYVATGAGTHATEYPWGPAMPDCTRAITDSDNKGCGFPKPVGFVPAQISGVFDLIGGVSEWTWDAVVSDGGIPYPPDATDYPGPAFQGTVAARNSFWIESSYDIGPATLDMVANAGPEAQYGYADLGFRCAMTLP